MPSPLRVPMDPSLPICTSGKRPFKTREEAGFHLGRARYLRSLDPDGRRHGGTERGVMFCQACQHYHLESSDGSRRQTRGSKQRRRNDRMP